jgi:hypothetical protein
VSDQRWDYCCGSHPTGYCHTYKPIPEDEGLGEWAKRANEKLAPLAANFHDTGHATEAEAQECYKKYMLDTSLRLTPKEPENPHQLNRCQVCGTFTACHAYVGAYQIFTLCPEHQTRETVESLYEVGESWES